MPSNPDSLSVRSLQVDASGDPWDEPLDVETDGAKIAAIFVVEPSHNDKLTGIWRDGNDLRIRDVTNPGTAGAGHTLTELLAVSEDGHEALDTLTHDIAESSFEQYTYSGHKVTNITVYTDAGKTKKIREEQISYSGSKVSQYITIQYDDSGVESYRITETYTYISNVISSITRTRT